MKYLKKFEQQLSLFPDIVPNEKKYNKKRRELIEYLKEKELLDVRKFKSLPFHVIYYLYNEGILSKKKFVNMFDDLIIDNDNIVMVISDWSDIKCWYDKSKWCEGILTGDGDVFDYGDYSGYNFEFYNFDIIKGKTLTELKETMNGIEFTYEDVEYTIDKNNIIEDKELKYVDTNIDIDVKELIEDYDEFSEIKDALNFAYQDCQQAADYDECHDAILSALQEAFGKIQYEENGSMYHGEEVYFKINLDEVADMDEEYFKWKGTYEVSSIIDLFNEEYKDRTDGISVEQPNYGWSGDVKNEDLNDRIYERLREI